MPTSVSKKEASEKSKDAKRTPKLLRGFKDILPSEEKYWDFVFCTVARITKEYNFSFINTPVLEEASLFERSAGESSDVVNKEMFKFMLPKSNDEHDSRREVVLRPEGTAPIVRAYLEHGMISQPQPVKLWYIGPMFRYERPQAGRYRQHNQFGIEILGDSSPLVDAQVIIVAYQIFKALGLDVVFPINTIGDSECRPSYVNSLREYFNPLSRKMCSDCRKRLKNNPLRILDCKEEKCQEYIEDAPQVVDSVCDSCREHFVSVLEYLDELDIPYVLNSRLVRGFDYYTRTTFEVFLKKDYEDLGTRATALSGGGRYDGLAQMIGGRQVPGMGFAQGIERVILAIKENCEIPTRTDTCDIFVAQLGNEAKRKALGLYENLRAEGFKVAENFSKDGLSAQLDRANKLNAKLAVILGQKEILDGTVIVRDMLSGIQEEINYNKLLVELRRRLESVSENGNGIRVGDTEIDTGENAESGELSDDGDLFDEQDIIDGKEVIPGD